MGCHASTAAAIEKRDGEDECAIHRYALGRVAGIALFSALSSNDTAELDVKEITYCQGEDIVTQGQEIFGTDIINSWIYVMQQGRAEVLQDGVRVNLIHKGDVIGERALLQHLHQRTATVRCIDVECNVVAIGIRSLEKALGLEHEAIEVDPASGALQLSPADVIARLRAFPILATLSGSSFDMLAKQVTVRRCEPGELVLRRGEEGQEFFLLDRGRIGVLEAEEEGSRERTCSEAKDDDNKDCSAEGHATAGGTHLLFQAFRGTLASKPSKHVVRAILDYAEASQREVAMPSPTRPAAHTQQRVKATLRAGQFFGESALLVGADGRRTASVVALTHVTLLVMNKDAFTNLMRRLEGFPTP